MYSELRSKKDHESHKRTKYTNKLPKGDDLEAPEPGTIMIKDYRKEVKNEKAKRNHIRIITWNIERGYRINEVIQELQAKDADIILLQEVDIGTKRTNMMDIGSEIASALSMQMVYSADCWKINTYHENIPDCFRNDSEISYNSLPHNGCEGNAILTRFDIIKAYPVIMPCVRNTSAPSHDVMKRHTATVAIIDTREYNIGELVCYSLHFDAYSGRIARSTVQYKSIYEDIIKNHTLSKHHQSVDGVIKKRRAVVVGGDFNTHNHGIVRFVDKLSGDDAFRYKFWGLSEAQWWDKYVIGKELHLIANLAPSLRIRLKDPFNKSKDVTHWKIWNGITVWSGKIDWLLYDIDRFAVVNKEISNTTASDHQYLLCDITAKI